MSDFGSLPSDAPRTPPPSSPPPPPPSMAPPPPPSMMPPPPSMAAPPGYVAYGTPGAAMSPGLSRVKGVSKALDVLLIISIPFQALALLGSLQLRDKARDYLSGAISEEDFTQASRANIGSIAGLLVVPIAVLTIIIMFRMASNVRAVGRPGQTWVPGWAIGSWFLPPCVVYALPWLMFRELWRGSDASVPPSDPSWKQRPVSPLVNVWWVLYGLVPLVGLATSANFVAGLGNVEVRDVAERIDDFLAINLVLGVVGIGTTVVYMLMMRRLTARHVEMTRES